jgi:hypothetical protein
MRYADLSPSTQSLLIGLLAVAMAAILIRVVVFLRREIAGMPPLYPQAWSAAQCRALECFRLLVGVALIALWGVFLFVAPSMPTNSPFGLLEMISLIVLLLISNAWILLLVPRNWEKLGAYSQSFWLTMTFLMVWWVSVFAATGWMLASASVSSPRLVLPVGVFATQRPLLLTSKLAQSSAESAPDRLNEPETPPFTG